jgi:HK97 family phage portal protein
MIGDSTASTSWGTGIAEQKLGFLTFSLEPHLKGWEQSLDYTLLTVNEREAGYYFKFNRRALLQAAPAAQAAFLQSMRSIGVYSINDCRSYLDENELDDATIGDDYTRPLNNTGGVSPTQTAAPTADPEP